MILSISSNLLLSENSEDFFMTILGLNKYRIAIILTFNS